MGNEGARTLLRELVESWERNAVGNSDYRYREALQFCAAELRKTLAPEGPGEAERLRGALEQIAELPLGDHRMKGIAREAFAGAQVPAPTLEDLQQIARAAATNAQGEEISIELNESIVQKLTPWMKGLLSAAAPQPQEGAALRPEQLIAVSFDPTQDASLPPKGRWIYLETALKTIDAVRKEASLEGWRDCLRHVTASLIGYPDHGGDIEIMKAVENIRKETRIDEHLKSCEECKKIAAGLPWRCERIVKLRALATAPKGSQ